MGNGLFQRHGKHFSTAGIRGTLDAICLVIEKPQVVVHEANQPDLATRGGLAGRNDRFGAEIIDRRSSVRSRQDFRKPDGAI